ncbi:EAL domain-containing protein [Henriciella sp. AS95]|uniref:sensor domain-containing phosphodiesterase n=1 Tax=Henriciella sp. AS95 TaxID=3135782 RepID=UPI003180E0C5
MTTSSTLYNAAFFNGPAGSDQVIDRALDAIRRHLGMPIAYISEFVGNTSVFRHVDAPGLEDMIKVGDERSLDDVYCRHIVEGRLPELIPNTANNSIAAKMPITAAVPIGSHASIPIKLEDGSVYGMFCCLSPEPNDSLNERDLETMRMFASLAADQIRRHHAATQTYNEKLDRIRQVITDQSYRIVYQPIVDLLSSRTVGYEALSRFDASPARTPDLWFGEAEQVGLSQELELDAIRRALEATRRIDDGQYISVNASPHLVCSAPFLELMAKAPLGQISLEVTEHAAVENYETFQAVIEPLRKAGMKLAIDDAGAGHSSLRHILQLSPDFLKLDMSLTRNVDEDLSRRALISALVYYTRETGSQIIAEGIETEGELTMLKRLGVSRGQGYFLGRPSVDAIETTRSNRKVLKEA